MKVEDFLHITDAITAENGSSPVWRKSDIIRYLHKYAKFKCAEQRAICQRLRDAETNGLIDETIVPVYANCPEPKFD